MTVIGITGGIASGKSTAAKYIAQKGYKVFDADAVCHALTAKNGKALPLIKEHFGADFVRNGELDRALMAQAVFNDPQKRKKLENILHPLVISECKLYMQACADEQFCFLDVPLLFESGMDSLCDEVWLISAPIKERISRLQERSGMAESQARARIRSQMPEYKKRRLATHIIDTRGEVETTRAHIDRLIRNAINRSKKGLDK